ncbi:MAG: hypothetical protein KF822_09580 [Steroidobacteraceae bacterium]|nr:hypothetical protein [Steroidobacteraceae bacterium]
MFALTDTAADFEHMNTYAEKHGEETVNGLALKFGVVQPMVALDAFAPGLLSSVYQKDGLRFPDLGPLRWKRELVGATVSIESDDLLGERNVQFDLATVDKFVLEAQEGGSVAISFRVKVKPTPEQVAVLYQLQHTEVTLTIDPAWAEDQPAGGDLLDGSAEEDA